MAVIEELIENLIMAHDMLYEDDHASSGKLDEDEGDKKEEEKPENKYAEFEKYIGIVADQFSGFIMDEFDKAMPDGKTPESLRDNLAKISENLMKTIEIVKSARFSREDPGATGNQEVNNIMSSALTSIVSIKGSLDMLADWTKELSKIIKKAGGDDDAIKTKTKALFGLSESFIHRNSLSSLLLEAVDLKAPRGSILYLVKGIQNKEYIDNLGGENAEIVKSLKKHVEKLGKDSKGLREKTKDFKSVSGAIDKLFGKSRFEEKKGIVSRVVGFFKKMFTSAAAAIKLQPYTINGESLLGGENPALLQVNPEAIVDLQKSVSGRLNKIKKQVAIARDQLKFGGMDNERIAAMVKQDGGKAFNYMDKKENLFGDYANDKTPLAGAMISAEYFGENIHRNTMTDLLFEDAAEFIALVNKGIEDSKYKGRVTGNLNKKTVDNLNKIFPNLNGLLLQVKPEQVELPEEDTGNDLLNRYIKEFGGLTAGREMAATLSQMIDITNQSDNVDVVIENGKVLFIMKDDPRVNKGLIKLPSPADYEDMSPEEQERIADEIADFGEEEGLPEDTTIEGLEDLLQGDTGPKELENAIPDLEVKEEEGGGFTIETSESDTVPTFKIENISGNAFYPTDAPGSDYGPRMLKDILAGKQEEIDENTADAMERGWYQLNKEDNLITRIEKVFEDNNWFGAEINEKTKDIPFGIFQRAMFGVMDDGSKLRSKSEEETTGPKEAIANLQKVIESGSESEYIGSLDVKPIEAFDKVIGFEIVKGSGSAKKTDDKKPALNREEIKSALQTASGWKEENKENQNRIESGLLSALNNLSNKGNEEPRLGESFIHKRSLKELMIENRIEFRDLEDAFAKALKDEGVSEEEIPELVEKMKGYLAGYSGNKVIKKFKDIGINIANPKKDSEAKPRTGITILNRNWDQGKKMFYQKAKTNAARYANDSGGDKQIQQRILKNEDELTAMMKSFNSISKETTGLKAPIFPEGKRRNKSKLIHKRSLTESLFSDDD